LLGIAYFTLLGFFYVITCEKFDIWKAFSKSMVYNRRNGILVFKESIFRPPPRGANTIIIPPYVVCPLSFRGRGVGWGREGEMSSC